MKADEANDKVVAYYREINRQSWNEDAVIEALDRWKERSKWWPTWAELLEVYREVARERVAASHAALPPANGHEDFGTRVERLLGKIEGNMLLSRLGCSRWQDFILPREMSPQAWHSHLDYSDADLAKLLRAMDTNPALRPQRGMRWTKPPISLAEARKLAEDDSRWADMPDSDPDLRHAGAGLRQAMLRLLDTADERAVGA